MTPTVRRNITSYLPVVVFICLALLGGPEMKKIFRRVLVLAAFAFCWGIAFTALLLDRFVKRHEIQRDGDDLSRLMSGSGVFMLNLSLFSGFILESVLHFYG